MYSDFVEQAISDLLATGSVVECDSAPIVVNPLSVSVQSNGKKKAYSVLAFFIPLATSELRRKLVTNNDALCILGPFCGTLR